MKRGSIVGSAVLGAIEIGEGVSTDYNDYQTKGETNGKNMYGSKAMLANKNLDKSASTLNNARINRIKAKTIQSAVKNGKVVNEGFQNWVIDKVKSFFGSEK